ncbi:hypothetical protein GCM10027440_43050 [Nocardiopsis coralliicola]
MPENPGGDGVSVSRETWTTPQTPTLDSPFVAATDPAPGGPSPEAQNPSAQAPLTQAPGAVSHGAVSRETAAGSTAGSFAQNAMAGAAAPDSHQAVPDYAGGVRGTVDSGREGDDGVPDTPIARAARAAMSVRGYREDRWPRPGECRIISVANQKGGVGKTTTTVNIAASLAMHGNRVLVVDLDPQGNASTALGAERSGNSGSIYHCLVEDAPLKDLAQPVPDIEGLWCVPATIDLAGAEIELVSLVARESRLKRAFAAYDSGELDYIFIDCPPSLGLLTVNAMVACDEVLIPIQCEYYALEGLGQLLRNVDLVKSHLNPSLAISTILLTMYDGRTRLASQVADEVRQHFGDLVLKTLVPRSVRVSEAPSYGQSVMTYDPGSTGAVAYMEAAREMAYQAETGAAVG